ncbi:hypothetical protein PLA107_002090 [Pseudomonas amygdali pv. lachrymans str. M301315]|uniref:Uncharacterized protein n=1 Tax=Pseudomonas amygdali pv. lachrymans str. M301315 TaxID=629260 RepID=A0AAD0PM12_PSEAV|nr:hypothetical protein PLA107_002090 [Pseudomonas amygdali pv. lachrymans str. M301315]PWD01564.1 hypothetical protein CX658_16325 [Pseudomonas amygdali pv. lachrymans]
MQTTESGQWRHFAILPRRIARLASWGWRSPYLIKPRRSNDVMTSHGGQPASKPRIQSDTYRFLACMAGP